MSVSGCLLRWGTVPRLSVSPNQPSVRKHESIVARRRAFMLVGIASDTDREGGGREERAVTLRLPKDFDCALPRSRRSGPADRIVCGLTQPTPCWALFGLGGRRAYSAPDMFLKTQRPAACRSASTAWPSSRPFTSLIASFSRQANVRFKRRSRSPCR